MGLISNFSIKILNNKITSCKLKLSVHNTTVLEFISQNPSPINQKAIPLAVKRSIIFNGTIFINFLSFKMYHYLWILDKEGRALEDKWYWVTGLPELGLGQGWGPVLLHISL